MEIVTLERSLALNVQGRRSKVNYLRAFKANADAINLAGGYANYDLADPIKQAKVMEEAAKRYLAALAFTGLNSERHKQLKADVRHDWVQNNTDSLPRTLQALDGDGRRLQNKRQATPGPTRSWGGADEHRRPRSVGAWPRRTQRRRRTRSTWWTWQTRTRKEQRRRLRQQRKRIL